MIKEAFATRTSRCLILHLPGRLHASARWLKSHRAPRLCLLYVLIMGLAAAFPALFAPHNPFAVSLDDALKPPAWLSGGMLSHPLGTDQLGRDLLSRTIYGARVSMQVSFATVVVGGTIGLIAGLISGYLGGWVDTVIMRIVDGIMSVPLILIALVMAVTLGPDLKNVIVIISAIMWAAYARIIRSEVLSLRERTFVRAAQTMGASTARILLRHIFPHVLPTLTVIATGTLGTVILAEAGLSFLGAGVPPPAPSWGSMVAAGRSETLTAWWIAFFPGLAILFLSLSFSLLGDWLRDTLDPKLS